MLKRIGLYSAALFATLALTQLPAASAQNRDFNDRDAHQTSSYHQTNDRSNSYSHNRWAVRQSNDRSRSDKRATNYRHESQRNRRSMDNDDRWER